MPPSVPLAPPVFPGTRPRDGLKATTRARLLQAKLRRHVQPESAVPMVLTRYVPQEHGCDVLAYWWQAAYTLNEHLDMLGAVAATPIKCIQAYAACDLMVMHDPERAWQQWDGVAAVFWSSDVLPRSRYRLDYWIAPHLRHPVMTAQIAQGVLHHLFEVRDFRLVWGITPVTNRPARRVLLRLGFTKRQVWQDGTIDPHTGAPLDAVVTLLHREAWRRLGDARGRAEVPRVSRYEADAWMFDTPDSQP